MQPATIIIRHYVNRGGVIGVMTMAARDVKMTNGGRTIQALMKIDVCNIRY